MEVGGILILLFINTLIYFDVCFKTFRFDLVKWIGKKNPTANTKRNAVHVYYSILLFV